MRAEGHQVPVASEHQLLALPGLSAALVHADPQAHDGTDYHAPSWRRIAEIDQADTGIVIKASGDGYLALAPSS